MARYGEARQTLRLTKCGEPAFYSLGKLADLRGVSSDIVSVATSNRTMQKVFAASIIIGIALVVGALVQFYYSGLPVEAAWSPPALYSLLGAMILGIELWPFR